MSRMISARLSRLERAGTPDKELFTVSACPLTEGQPEPADDAFAVLTEAEWVQAHCEPQEQPIIN